MCAHMVSFGPAASAIVQAFLDQSFCDVKYLCCPLDLDLSMANDDAVFPEGPAAIAGQELSGEYYEKAAPVIEVQVARAGYRLAAWLDLIVAAAMAEVEL